VKAHSNNCISSLSNTFSNNVNINIVNIAIFCTELVLIFFFFVIGIGFFNLIRQCMCLSHLGISILHLLHLNMLHYKLLSFSQLFFFVGHSSGLTGLELAQLLLVVSSRGIHGVAHFRYSGLALVFIDVVIVLEIPLALGVLHILILGTWLRGILLGYLPAITPLIIGCSGPFIKLYIIQLYLPNITICHSRINNRFISLHRSIINIHHFPLV
jgi:hypothetical protein